MLYYLVHWLLASLCILATARFVPGFTITNFGSAMLAAVVIGFLNITVWPVLAILTFPLTIVTFGLFLFVLNALVLKLGAGLVPGFTINGFTPALIGSLVLMFLGWLVRYLLLPAATQI